MSGLRLHKILIITLLSNYIFLASSLTSAHEMTEQFIPIGMSPGISNKYSYIGNISGVDRASNTILMRADDSTITISISPSTRIWLDRSKMKKTNIDASFDELEVGRRIEVMHSRKDANTAVWIKIESS